MCTCTCPRLGAQGHMSATPCSPLREEPVPQAPCAGEENCKALIMLPCCTGPSRRRNSVFQVFCLTLASQQLWGGGQKKVGMWVGEVRVHGGGFVVPGNSLKSWLRQKEPMTRHPRALAHFPFPNPSPSRRPSPGSSGGEGMDFPSILPQSRYLFSLQGFSLVGPLAR